MSSINLLPQNKIKEKREIEAEKNDNIPMILSFLLIIIVSSSVVGLYYYKQLYTKKSDSLSGEILKVDQSLEEATKNSELLSTETIAKDDSFMLATHPYFSKILDFIQNNLGDEVFLSSVLIKIDPEFVNVSLEANTKDYLSVSSQISILKRAKSVESVIVREISDENGLYTFPVTINLNKEIIFESGNKVPEDKEIGS